MKEIIAEDFKELVEKKGKRIFTAYNT